MAPQAHSLAEPAADRLLPAVELLQRWRCYNERIQRWRTVFWCAIACGMIGVLVVTRSPSPRSLGLLLPLAAGALVFIVLARFHAAHAPRLARRLGLACPECDRPLDETTIMFALETGQCWHCQPPIVAEDAARPDPREPYRESGNPYQAPSDGQSLPPAAVAKPPVAVRGLSFGMSLFFGPLAPILIYNLLTSSEEWCCQNNPPPGPEKSADEQAAYRRRIVTVFRRQGWFLLTWMVLAVGSVLSVAWLTEPVPSRLSGFDRVVFYGVSYVLASGVALWVAFKLNRHAPKPLLRWLGAIADPTSASVEQESGLLCAQVVFSPADLSRLPKRRRFAVRWRSDEVRPLNVILWRQGRGVIHRQTLPGPGTAGQWHDQRCQIPYALAGEDARWSEVKVLLYLDPPGPLDVAEVLT